MRFSFSCADGYGSEPTLPAASRAHRRSSSNSSVIRAFAGCALSGPLTSVANRGFWPKNVSRSPVARLHRDSASPACTIALHTRRLWRRGLRAVGISSATGSGCARPPPPPLAGVELRPIVDPIRDPHLGPSLSAVRALHLGGLARGLSAKSGATGEDLMLRTPRSLRDRRDRSLAGHPVEVLVRCRQVHNRPLLAREAAWASLVSLLSLSSFRVRRSCVEINSRVPFAFHPLLASSSSTAIWARRPVRRISTETNGSSSEIPPHSRSTDQMLGIHSGR